MIRATANPHEKLVHNSPNGLMLPQALELMNKGWRRCSFSYSGVWLEFVFSRFWQEQTVGHGTRSVLHYPPLPQDSQKLPFHMVSSFFPVQRCLSSKMICVTHIGMHLNCQEWMLLYAQKAALRQRPRNSTRKSFHAKVYLGNWLRSSSASLACQDTI